MRNYKLIALAILVYGNFQHFSLMAQLDPKPKTNTIFKKYVINEAEFVSELILKKDSSWEYFYANTNFLLKYSYGKFHVMNDTVYLNTDTNALKFAKNTTIKKKYNWRRYSFVFFSNGKILLKQNSFMELPPYTKINFLKGSVYVTEIIR